MSDSFDKLQDLRELALFPLPVVLFPGVPMPLHIFEPRYRQLLKDVSAGSNVFGLPYFDVSETTQNAPPVGHVGCVAEIIEVQALPDGRSNILTVGLVRYQLEEYVDYGDPYLVGRISLVEDEEEDEVKLTRKAEEVASLFMRIAQSVSLLNDNRVQLPDLSESSPEHLSFLVAAAMDLDVEIKQQILELRSTSQRLRMVKEFLESAVTAYEERARLYTVSKGNGHSNKKLDIE
jgi:ATP-dependent Lon protease